jgi:hypothetical protein
MQITPITELGMRLDASTARLSRARIVVHRPKHPMPMRG